MVKLGRLLRRLWTPRPEPRGVVLVVGDQVVRIRPGVVINPENPDHLSGRIHGRALLLPPGEC